MPARSLTLDGKIIAGKFARILIICADENLNLNVGLIIVRSCAIMKRSSLHNFVISINKLWKGMIRIAVNGVDWRAEGKFPVSSLGIIDFVSCKINCRLSLEAGFRI